MNRVKNRTDIKTTAKMIVVFVIFLGAAALVIGRLADYQLNMNEYYQSKVLNQLTIQQEVNPERGTITDRNGNILAANKTVYNVILSPYDIIQTMEDNDKLNSDSDPENDVEYTYTDADYGISYSGSKLDEMIADVLSGYCGIDREKILEKEAKVERMYEVVKNGIEGELADRIKAFIAQFDLSREIYFVTSSKRYYPKGDLASHVIGFTNSEGVGIYGLEAYYNNVLEGTSGRYILAKNVPFEYERFIEAENGYNIVTTLDMYIQYELENQLERTYIDSGCGDRVCGMVLDVDTGDVLAMAVFPPFDLNNPYTLDEYSQAKLDAMGLTEGTEEYREAFYTLLYRMWNNKCITETYEPGSTFKIITTAMAFEEGVVRDTDPYYCAGSLMVEGWGRPISCAEHDGHGAVTFRRGLQQSCNPTLMQVAAKIGREKFYEYFLAFGYGGKTGIDLPGEVGGIYSSYANFSGVSLAVYSFGQTFKTTPIQQMRAISAVANGGYLTTPHLLREIVDDDGNTVQSYKTEQIRQVVSEGSCEIITDILEEGVATDGAAVNAYVKGYRVAAKTGTSEKRDEYDENGNTPYRVGSTAAYAPADDPQVAALIMVDKPLESSPYGGVVAAPYISNLLSYVLPYIGVEPQYTTEELAALDVTLSNYVGASLENTTADLVWRGFKYEIIGDGDTVTAQIPPAGSKISSDTGVLILYTGEEKPSDSVQVPDLMGMSAYNANNAAVSAGLNVIFTGYTNGTATVISQTLQPGSWVPRGSIIEIELRYLDGVD
ncbi:MAG: PASTA domain-containing protein [Clostridia bacterium]|nr:PASTA domain-containing protein [Clostridia bacterium]